MNFDFYKNIKNYKPKVCLDLGAFKGEWGSEIKNIFPETLMISVDANQYFDKIPSSDYSFYEVLSNVDNQEIIFYKTNHDFSIGTGDSIFKENTKYYSNNNIIEEIRLTKKISTLITPLNIQKIDIVKVDTQGSELLILIGLDNYLESVDFIQIEVSLIEYNLGGPKIFDVLEFLNENNYEIFDITESLRDSEGSLLQIDFILKNKKINLTKTF